LATNSKDDRPNLQYSIHHNGVEIRPEKQWIWAKSRFDAAYANDEIVISENDGKYSVRAKQYLRDENGKERLGKPLSFMSGPFNQEGTKEIKSIFGKTVFDFPKPTHLIAYLASFVVNEENDSESIFLDFFSGSAAAAHAVMQLNAEDGGTRRHIMVQLPEPCDEKSEAFKAGYATIAEIGKERIRRAGKKIRTELEEKLARELPGSDEHASLKARLDSLDTGFRVLKIDSSNFTDVYYQPDELTQDALSLQVDNLKRGRSSEDLLFQVLLDWGVDLALPVTEERIAGRQVFFVDGDALAACFDTGLDEAFIKALAGRAPLRAVFRDAGYASDAVKINIEQIFKALSPHTELKTL
jgi:adenine-specific DNA-methyltransferase